MQVPVEIHGKLPVIAFNARYLAEALEIGSALCLSDELSPCILPSPHRPLLRHHADAGDDPGGDQRRNHGFAATPHSGSRLIQ